MTAVALRFYVIRSRENDEFLLHRRPPETAGKIGIHDGSAFLSVAGYGRHGVLHTFCTRTLTECVRVERGRSASR